MCARAGGFQLIAPAEIGEAIARVRTATGIELPQSRIASALALTCDSWRDRDLPVRRGAIESISARSGFSTALLEESLDALLGNFTTSEIERAAIAVAPRRQVAGFIMPGNVAGAGLHELVMALLAGCGAVIKTASGEPEFFPAFASTLSQIDSTLGARIAALTWSRADADATRVLAGGSDYLVALGDDSTLAAIDGECPRIFGFDSRLSIAIVSKDALHHDTADHVARDVTLFEQLGCLSPHHVFVTGADDSCVREFATLLAGPLDRLARELPPPTRLALDDAAAVRRARETARWRALSGEPVELRETAGLGWTIVVDPRAAITPSPGFRTVTVSSFSDLSELRERLRPAMGKIEACALAGDAISCGAISALGIPYVCSAGAIQSPPLSWRHGGGAFLDFLTGQ